jgi:hypothetical protein
MGPGHGPLEAAVRALAHPVLPPELRREIEFARRRSAQLASQDRQLDFCRDRVTGRIVVCVRDLEGGLVRVIASTEALDVIAGAELD